MAGGQSRVKAEKPAMRQRQQRPHVDVCNLLLLNTELRPHPETQRCPRQQTVVRDGSEGLCLVVGGYTSPSLNGGHSVPSVESCDTDEDLKPQTEEESLTTVSLERFLSPGGKDKRTEAEIDSPKGTFSAS